ncbi:30S ribosomal protein S2 [Candidatus Aenigmatarchaeota archaeon]
MAEKTTEVKERLLISREKYLSSGVHIGMTFKTADMKRFIYKIRPNGLAVLNIGTLDERIRYTSKMLANKERILIVTKRESGFEAIKKFCDVVNAKSVLGRFMPGSLTNPTYKNFMEAEVLIILDPLHDKQAIKEAVQMRTPIIGIADTSNETSFIDIVLPANNKAKKSIALIFWLLAREIMKIRGEEFKYELKDFGFE